MVKSVFLAALVCVIVVSCFGADAVRVDAVNPARRDVADWIRLPGNTDAEVEVSLFSRASGVLTGFSLDVGDKVQPGQTIGKIDAPDLEQDVKLAESQITYANAEWMSAKALLERVKIRGVELDANEAILKAGVGKEKAELALAVAQYARIKRLFDTNAATDEERENHDLAVDVHKAAVVSANTKLSEMTAERQLWKKDEEAAVAAVESAKGKVAIAEATLNRAKVLYDFTILKVPTLGLGKAASSAMVLKRFVSNGDLIVGGGTSMSKSGQAPLVTVVVTDPIRVIADIPEAESKSIQSGTVVQAAFTAFPKDAPIAGKIARISPSFTANTRSLHIEMDVPNPNGKLRAGMMTYIEVVTDVHKGVLAVPQSALQSNPKQGASVFKIQEGRAKRIPVEVGYADHGWVEVRGEALDEATAIIKDIRNGMSDGALVEIMKPPAVAVEAAAH